MNENLLQCSVLEDDPSVVDRVEYEPPWEDWKREEEENQRQWLNEEERRLKERANYMLEAERQLHDPHQIRKHTNRLLWRASKGLESFRRTLALDYHAHIQRQLSHEGALIIPPERTSGG